MKTFFDVHSRTTYWLVAVNAVMISVAVFACQQSMSVGDSDDGFEVCRHSDGPLRQAIIGAPQLCGSCDPTCYQTLDVPDDADLTDENAEGVCYDEDLEGLVVCDEGGETTGGLYAFIANATDSTVSKMSLETGDEVGRYLVGLPDKRCSCHCDGCNQPSRTAVDSRGYGYVASRAFGGQGSVTKIAGEITSCVDRNLNGVIDTSAGGADLKAWGEDECVIWTVPVAEPDCIPCPPDCEDDCNFLVDPECIPCGASCSKAPECTRAGVPRALAVDAQDRLWVGAYYEKRFYVLNLSDGSLVKRVDIDLQPYGASIGPAGKVWFPDGCCSARDIQYVDARTYEKGVPVANTSKCPGSYGITVDTKGRVILGGWPNDCVSRYDPASGDWIEFPTEKNVGIRGVCIDIDDGIWAAGHNPNPNVTKAMGADFVIHWDEDGGNEEAYTSSKCAIPIGLAADFSGHIWVVCQMRSAVTKIDYLSSGPNTHHDTGPYPYTYSDFTGFHRAIVTAPEGHYVRLHDAALSCEDDREALWSQLYWDVETPADTSIEFWGRTAETADAMTFAPEVLLASVPSDESPSSVSSALEDAGELNFQRYLEVRVKLRVAGNGDSPVFTNMRLVHYCQCTCDVDATCSFDCDCDEDC